MAFTSVAGLITTLIGMAVTGIDSASKFAYPPEIVNAAQTPILYIRTPSVTRPLSTLTYAQGLKEGTAEVVILVGEMTLNMQENNLARAATLEDALSTALEANAEALGMDNYTITLEPDELGGDTPFWALVATVEVSG